MQFAVAFDSNNLGRSRGIIKQQPRIGEQSINVEEVIEGPREAPSHILLGKSVRKLQEDALTALRRAVARVVDEDTRAGLPVYVWKNGKVVDLNAPKRRASAKRAKASRKTNR